MPRSGSGDRKVSVRVLVCSTTRDYHITRDSPSFPLLLEVPLADAKGGKEACERLGKAILAALAPFRKADVQHHEPGACFTMARNRGGAFAVYATTHHVCFFPKHMSQFQDSVPSDLNLGHIVKVNTKDRSNTTLLCSSRYDHVPI